MVGELQGENVIGSKQLIGWYNSHPDLSGFGKKAIKDWHSLRDVVVVGYIFPH